MGSARAHGEAARRGRRSCEPGKAPGSSGPRVGAEARRSTGWLPAWGLAGWPGDRAPPELQQIL